MYLIQIKNIMSFNNPLIPSIYFPIISLAQYVGYSIYIIVLKSKDVSHARYHIEVIGL